jgi:hypothetical protein
MYIPIADRNLTYPGYSVQDCFDVPGYVLVAQDNGW